MPAQSKYEMLEKVNTSLDASQGLFVVDYRGLTVKETQEFRRSLREVGANMKVYKNSIVRIALKEKNLPEIDDILEGTCAYIFFENDSVDAAKVIKDVSQKLKKIEVMGGIADGKALNADEAKAYADLPNRSQLLGMIAGAISGIARGLAVSINEIPAGLARSINAIHEQQDAA